MPSIAFTGIAAIHKAIVSKHRGVKPSKATLICRAQGSSPPSIGTLTLSDGNASESWQEAAIAWAQRRHITNTSPHLVSVIVADRRWRWRQKTISGVYNTRLDDGTVSETNKKSVQELITVIFQAMGESVDASAAPNDMYPAVNWSGTRCDKAIHKLLKLVGCEIAIDYQSNQTRVYRRGTGGQLPATGTEIEPPLTVTNGPLPGTLRVDCAPVLVQSKIKLEPVGIDTDGSLKRIEDLSYKPTGGWTEEWPLDFAGITDETNRALAQQSVWRLWAIKEFAEGGLSIPQITGFAITKPTQLLPLRERLLETDKDHNDVQRQNFPYLEGATVYTDTDTTPARYNGKFDIIYDQGIVITESPVFKLTSAGISEPTLYITVAHHIRDANTDGLVSYFRDRTIGVGSTITDSVPEFVRTIIRLYEGTSPSTVTDNKSTLDAEADKYLDAMQVRYAPVDAPSSMRYRGFTFPTLDGAIAQVVHRMYGGKAETDASRGYEDDVFSPSERQRESDLAFQESKTERIWPSQPIPYSGISKFLVHAGDGRITGTLSALGSQTCRIWVRIGGTMTNTGIDITVHDTLLKAGSTLTDKWRVIWEWRNDRYVVAGAACQADTSATVWGT